MLQSKQFPKGVRHAKFVHSDANQRQQRHKVNNNIVMAGHSLGEQCVPLLCVVGLAPREVQLQMPVETSLSVGAEYENDQRHIRSTQRQRGTI